MLAVLTQRSHPRARALLAHSCRSEVLLMVPAHAGAVSSSFGAYNGRHRSALAHVQALQGIGNSSRCGGCTSVFHIPSQLKSPRGDTCSFTRPSK